MKFRAIVQAILALAAASAAMVGVSAAQEAVKAPVATFHVDCYTAQPGCEQLVAERQDLIRNLRTARLTELADDLQQRMLDELMTLRWSEVKPNTVTTAGKNDLLDKYFAGSSYTASWFCGLISSVSYTAISAADTMASHSGWTEAGGTNAPTYTGNRPALAFSAASAGSKATSSASSFTFTGTGTIKGMFGTTITTKDGTTGILYNAVLFTGGDRAVVSTDVVNVSVTYSA